MLKYRESEDGQLCLPYCKPGQTHLLMGQEMTCSTRVLKCPSDMIYYQQKCYADCSAETLKTEIDYFQSDKSGVNECVSGC